MTDLKHRLAMQRRLARRERRRQEYRHGLRPFAVAAWNISKEHNVGGLVRTAHASAASEVLLVGEKDWNVEAARTAELFTEVTMLRNERALLDHVRNGGYELVAVELAPQAVNLFEAAYPDRPCFLLGAELEGVPDTLLRAASMVVQIPQWGLVPSLNLAIAGSIVIYDYLGKLHQKGGLQRPEGGLVAPPPDLPDDADHSS
jgi:tRNA G18 (ribose-2'-O)-methylase SpoU